MDHRVFELFLNFSGDAAQSDTQDTSSGNQDLEHRMQKVPPLLKQDKNYRQYYDPLAVSLGPYHHGKDELQYCEAFKQTALQMFVADSDHDTGYFHSQVLEHVDFARNCYIEGSTETYDDETFASMMLLDACFIINFILLQVQGEDSLVKYKITLHHLGHFVYAIAFRDMAKLENQIPFRILKQLMCLRYEKQLAEEMLNKFLTLVTIGEGKESEIASREDEKLPLHLVGAYREILVPESSNSISSNESQSGCLKHMGNYVKCCHLVQHISNFPCFPWRKEKDRGKGAKKYIHCFRSATDLKAKGIHFRPSKTDSLLGIKFKSGYFHAELEVPTWLVTVHTKNFFLNIIAYELCPRAVTEPVVAAYIEFMKSLIDNPKDVKELREKGILFTSFSDEEVANVYNEINTHGGMDRSIFQDVKEEIQAHYNNRAKIWLAELFYTYFRTPWTVIALFAAIFLLVLTFLQTYYTVRPS